MLVLNYLQDVRERIQILRRCSDWGGYVALSSDVIFIDEKNRHTGGGVSILSYICERYSGHLNLITNSYHLLCSNNVHPGKKSHFSIFDPYLKNSVENM